ncbi:MAG: ATP-binding protein, partial [Opitutales bacterium]
MSPETGEAQASKNLNARYAEFDFQSRKRYVGIAVLLALVCVPSGSIIDYFIYPERFLDFFVVRLIVDLLLVLLWFIFKNSRSDEFLKIRVLCVGMMQSIIVAFCVMIHLADGVNSPYYAGMMLVMYGVAVLIPWSSAETIFISVASIVLYAIAVLSEGESLTPNSVPILVNNLFFLTLTAAISVAASRALAANRLRDFQLQMQLADQNQKLQEVDRLKTDFFANISHELRTPLTLIASPVDEILARHQGLPEQVTNNLMIVQRNTLRLLKLINDLLDLTRLEQQPGSLFRRDRELSRFTVGIVNSVRHLAASKQQRLTVESCNEALPVAIDAGRFEKVVLNLLTNAIKYTQRGGTITVSMRSRDGRALLVVEDNGPGIPENLLERIFDRFFQVDSKRGAGAGQGVGIGLALAREIAEAHSGTLKAFSELRRGTRFEVELPLQSKGELELNDQSEDFVEPFRDTFSAADRVFLREIEQHVKLPDVGAGDATVLVADDESDMREFIVTLLAEKYHVIQTQHGGNVLELVEQHRPHVIVLDWMMPQLKGLDVCRAIKSHDRHSDCKVVMLTARADERSKIEALSAGADDFLTKPFGGTELHCRVQNLAAAASFQREINRANTELKESLDRLQETEQRLIQSEKVNAIESLSAG